MNDNVGWRQRIWIDPDRHGGDPCIRGTRIPVSIIVANIEEMSADEIIGHFPQLTREDISAALHFAIESIRLRAAKVA